MDGDTSGYQAGLRCSPPCPAMEVGRRLAAAGKPVWRTLWRGAKDDDPAVGRAAEAAISGIEEAVRDRKQAGPGGMWAGRRP